MPSRHPLSLYKKKVPRWWRQQKIPRSPRRPGPRSGCFLETSLLRLAYHGRVPQQYAHDHGQASWAVYDWFRRFDREKAGLPAPRPIARQSATSQAMAPQPVIVPVTLIDGGCGGTWTSRQCGIREMLPVPHRHHIVWIPKYRRKVLSGEVAVATRDAVRDACERHRVRLLAVETNVDHVHCFVSAPPSVPASRVAMLPKGASSRHLRQRFPRLERIRRDALRAPSYYIGTAGNVSAGTIRRYIEECRGQSGTGGAPKRGCECVARSRREGFAWAALIPGLKARAFPRLL
jgi:putative transposase